MKRTKPKVTPTKPNPNKPTMPDLPPAAKGKVSEQIKRAVGEEQYYLMLGKGA